MHNSYRVNISQIQEEKNKVNYNKKKWVRVLDYKISIEILFYMKTP